MISMLEIFWMSRDFMPKMTIYVWESSLNLSLIWHTHGTLFLPPRPIKPWYFHVDDKFILLNLYDAKQEQWCRSTIVPSNLLLYIQIYYSTSTASAVQPYIVMSNMRNVS